MDVKEQVRAYELEDELTRRFEGAVYVGMSNNDYLRALAGNTIRFMAEKIAALESGITPGEGGNLP
jgi:hypothetical protein